MERPGRGELNDGLTAGDISGVDHVFCHFDPSRAVEVEVQVSISWALRQS